MTLKDWEELSQMSNLHKFFRNYKKSIDIEVHKKGYLRGGPQINITKTHTCSVANDRTLLHKSFNKFSQALKFAKEYMRKH